MQVPARKAKCFESELFHMEKLYVEEPVACMLVLLGGKLTGSSRTICRKF